MNLDQLFAFPNPVNEKAARIVAGVVALTAVLILATGWWWLLVPLAYGFVARVLTGPTLSPLARIASRHVAPLLGEAKDVAGPPKRFAQGIGAVLTVSAALLALGGGDTTAAAVLLALLVIAATLESVFAVCLGCHMFALLMRAGVVPQSVCAECADLTLRQPAAASSALARPPQS
jgi:hypothetical protein